jgi:hypothetical protein
VLRRTGQWVEADGTPAADKAVTVKKRRAAVRFARVAVNDTKRLRSAKSPPVPNRAEGGGNRK